MIRDWNRAKEQGEEDPAAWYNPLAAPLDSAALPPKYDKFTMLSEQEGSNLDAALNAPDVAPKAPDSNDRSLAEPTITASAPKAVDAIKAGAERDRMTALMRAIEIGSRQIGAGITHQAPGETLLQPTSFEADARKQSNIDAQRSLEGGWKNRGFGLEERKITADEEQNKLMRAHQASVEARRVEEEKRKAGVEAEKFGYQKTHDAATLAETARGHGLSAAALSATLGLKAEAAKAKEESGRDEKLITAPDGRKFEARSKLEAPKLRAASADTQALKQSADKLISTINQSGFAMNPVGSYSKELDSMLADLDMKLKSDAMFALGVLNAGDLKVIRRSTGELSGWSPSNWGDVKNSSAVKNIQSTVRSALERMDARLAQEKPLNDSTPPQSSSTVRMAKDGKSKNVPSEDVDEWLAAGAVLQ